MTDEPRDIREALADIRALEVRLAEQKKFNELLAEELRQTNRSLKAALAQSDAEPVAWRYRYPNLSVWSLTQESEIADYALRDCIVEPLYAAPPRPDASAEPRVTLNEIEAAMDRVLERRGLKTQVDNLERRSAW